MRAIKKGATDQSVVIRIVDSGDGTPETGVVYNTSGIDLWYRREGEVLTSITEATLSALNDAHSDGGILHIGDGYYRLDLPDAAVATGSNGVMIGGTVTGMVVVGTYVHLVDYDPQNAVRLGLTALPDAAADAAGGLPISDAGGLDLDAQVGTKINDILMDTGTTLQGELDGIQADTEDIQSRLPAALTGDGNIKADTLRISGTTQTARDIGASVLLSVGTGTGQVNLSSGKVPATIAAGDLATDSITAAAVKADAASKIAAAVEAAILNEGDATALLAAIAAKVEEFILNDGDSSATLAAIGTAVWAAGTRTLTAGTNINGSTFTAIPWNAAWDAEVQSEVDDALVAQNLDHLLKIAVDTDFATTVHVDSVVGQLAQTSDGGFSRASDSLEAVRDRGDSAWITATGFSTLDAAGVRTAVGLASANLDTQLTAIDDYLDTELAALIATVGVAGAGLSAIPKTGYILASTGLDSVSTTLGAGVPSNFRERLMWLSQRFQGKGIYDTGAGTLIVKAADNTTTITTQTMTDSAGVQTQGQVT